MADKKELVDNIEKLLDKLPELNDEEKSRVSEIKELLDGIRKKIELENRNGMDR